MVWGRSNSCRAVSEQWCQVPQPHTADVATAVPVNLRAGEAAAAAEEKEVSGGARQCVAVFNRCFVCP
jgi:hypothetical protein